MIEAVISAKEMEKNPRLEAFDTKQSGSGGDVMGMEDFLQLLTVQIANQDPLEPMKDTEFISQMANVASLENMQRFTNGFNQFAESHKEVAAQAYLGRKVTVEADGGIRKAAVVEAVERSEDGEITVTLSGKQYPLSSIVRVELAGGSVTE